MKYWLIATALWCMSGLTQAQPAEEQVKQALQLSGISDYLQDISETLETGLKQREMEGFRLAVLSYPQLQAVVKKFYQPEDLLQRMAENMVADYDLNRYQTLINTLSSEQVQWLVQGMRQTRSDQGFSALQGFSRQFNFKALPEPRQQLIDDLDQAAVTTELLAGSQALGMVAMLSMLDALHTEDSQPRLEEQQLLNQSYQQFLDISRYTSRATLAYLTRGGNESVQQLTLRVYRGTVMQWFSQQAIDAMIATLSQVRAEMLQEIQRIRSGR